MKMLLQCLTAMIGIAWAIVWSWFTLFHLGATMPSELLLQLYTGGPIEAARGWLAYAGLIPRDFGELRAGFSWSALGLRVGDNILKLAVAVILFAGASWLRDFTSAKGKTGHRLR